MSNPFSIKSANSCVVRFALGHWRATVARNRCAQPLRGMCRVCTLSRLVAIERSQSRFAPVFDI